MNSRQIAAAAIVFFAIVFSIVIGTKTAKFADKYAGTEQNRINTAMQILNQ